MSVPSENLPVTYRSIMAAARRALNLCGKEHETAKQEFLDLVQHLIQEDQVKNLNLNQAYDIECMLDRMLKMNDVILSNFRSLSTGEQKEIYNQKPMKEIKKYDDIIQAMKHSRLDVFNINPANDFQAALWDFMHDPEEPAKKLTPDQAAKLFVLACEFSSPSVAEEFYRNVIAPMNPKPELRLAKSPYSQKTAVGVLLERYLKEEKFDRDWFHRVREWIGSTDEGLYYEVQELFFDPPKNLAILTEILKYYKEVVKDRSDKDLQDWLYRAIETGKEGLVNELLKDERLKAYFESNGPQLFSQFLNTRNVNAAKLLLNISGKDILSDDSLAKAYLILPFNSDLIQAMQECGAVVPKDQLSDLLNKLIRFGDTHAVNSLLNEGIYSQVGEVKVKEPPKDLINPIYLKLAQEYTPSLYYKIPMLLELRMSGAELPKNADLTPEQQRMVRACQYASEFRDMDREVFLTNLETYADIALGSRYNAKSKKNMIQAVINILREDPNAEMPGLLLTPIPMVNVKDAGKLFPKGSLLGNKHMCLVDVMDYNRNPISAMRRLKKYEETETMKAMKALKQQSPQKLQKEVLASLEKIIKRLEKKLGGYEGYRELDLNDPGKVKYDRLVQIHKAIAGDQFKGKSLKTILNAKFYYQDKTKYFTLVDTLNIQRSKAFSRAESVSLKAFLKDLHVKDFVKDWKSHSTQPAKQTSKPEGERGPK